MSASDLILSINALRARETLTRLNNLVRHTAALSRSTVRMTTPRCSRCGFLSSPAHIAEHNIACANGGERAYGIAFVYQRGAR